MWEWWNKYGNVDPIDYWFFENSRPRIRDRFNDIFSRTVITKICIERNKYVNPINYWFFENLRSPFNDTFSRMVITKICGCTTWSKDGDVDPIDFSKVEEVSETGVERRLLTSGYSEQSTYRIKRKNDRINMGKKHRYRIASRIYINRV